MALRVVELVAAAVQDADGGGERLQRRPQLVAHVGGEAPVAFQAGGQLVHHVVERGGERRQVRFLGRVEAGV